MSEINKIFGIGMGRVGSLSNCKAMEILGYKSSHSLKAYKHLDRGLEYTGDIDIAWRFEFLDIIYPNSKFIFMTRDIESWLKSIKIQFRPAKVKRQKQNRFLLFGTVSYRGERDEDLFRIGYHKYHARVFEYFKNRKEDLLVMNIVDGDGWGKLCKFLEKDVPNVPFPHEHKSIK